MLQLIGQTPLLDFPHCVFDYRYRCYTHGRDYRYLTSILSCKVVCRIIPYDAAMYSGYVGDYSIV